MSITHFGIGIDTARFGHHVTFLDSDIRTAAKDFHFQENHQGYQQLFDALEKLRAKYPEATFYIRIDAAGLYADNLIMALQAQNWPNVVISVGMPSMNKAYCQAHFEKRKADSVESLACARYAVVERPAAMQPLRRQFLTLRNVVASLEAIAKDSTRNVNRLHALLAQAFPELAMHVKDISKGYCLRLLEKYPTAKRLAAAKLESLLAIPHLKADLARTLHQAAQRSTASADDSVHEQLIKSRLAEIQAVRKRQAEMLKLLKKAWEALPQGPHRRILSIKGIGLQTAAALVAKMVSIDRFQTDNDLVGYFGVFPRQADSGTTPAGNAKQQSQRSMCPKGNDLVRRLLFTAAQVAVIHNPPVRALFARQMQSGKSYHVAIGHCMAKLLRQVHALWRKDEDFDPEYESHKANSQQPAPETKTAAGLKKKVVEPQGKEVTATSSSVRIKPQQAKRPPLNYALLKSQLQILEVLRAHRWQEQTRRGCQHRGPCPIHEGDSHDRSFAVNSSKQTFCCHRCGVKGNALDLLVTLSGLPLHEAAWRWIDTQQLDAPLLESATIIGNGKKEKAIRSSLA